MLAHYDKTNRRLIGRRIITKAWRLGRLPNGDLCAMKLIVPGVIMDLVQTGVLVQFLGNPARMIVSPQEIEYDPERAEQYAAADLARAERLAAAERARDAGGGS